MASKKSFAQIADVLDDVASDLRFFEKFDVRVLEEYPQGAISRKNQSGSQARRAFCLAVGDFLCEKSGKWMDGQVATLVDIALPQAEATTIVQVRAMRRETTSRGRKAQLN